MPSTLPLLAVPQLIGICFNWALLGVLNLQTYLYCEYFPDDRLALKLLVYAVWAWEWVQTGLLTATIVDIYAYDFGSRLSIAQSHNSWFSVAIMCGVSATVLQNFLSWRVYRLSRSWVLTVIMTVLSLIQGVASVFSGVLERKWETSDMAKGTALVPIYIWLCTSAVLDVLITISMTTLLLRKKTGLAHTNAMINRVVRLVVETGMLTASVTLSVLILFNVPSLRDTLLYEAPAMILSKTYANTLLTNLNSRQYIRRHDKHTVNLAKSTVQLNFARNTMESATGSSVSGAAPPINANQMKGFATVPDKLTEQKDRDWSRAGSERMRRNSIV
ncbi:hypothetical protein WOLCODRAFT_140447 [Wolfiporia cocos MD-104 SS10]|uniref:DUF6534 domain-containing protein n=1 Tax=Wolfiporia cocos (strain MD-104) TaxID=742152 RepID=A0A2H3J2R1_WOLCO|nr:hypothetical protein WOLCODRAFT_140447 [Wolfiporia cocos MD-104 SS10]